MESNAISANKCKKVKEKYFRKGYIEFHDYEKE